jgi:subtilisin family serine protease
MLRRLLVCLWMSCAALAAPGNGGRRVVVEPAVPLTAADRGDLAAKGLTLGRPLAGGKFLARLTGELRDARIASIEPLGHAMKLHRSAIREALRGNAFAELAVFFHDDVTLEDARAAILDAGGALEDVLPVRFERSRRLVVHLSGHALEKLARDERVLTVAGGSGRVARSHNVAAAGLAHVTELQSVQYGLSGTGVNLSMGELATAQTTHPDFNGRFSSSVIGGTDDNIKHATHVAGTMAGSGAANASAKGMAPSATLRLFPVDHWQDTKFYDLASAGITADNNSWGYILGWNHFDGAYWVFQNFEEYYGAYDLYYTAPLDDVTRVRNILITVSAGNEAQNPVLPANGAHRHFGDETTVYCYSGCDSAPCSGASFCEVPHMAGVPYGTVGDMASAKNIITVGAVNPNRNIEPYSSRGPTRDGRVKPDLVAPGRNLLSTAPLGEYATMTGTSMAAPVVTGIAALLTEQWRITFRGDPLPAHLKTVMIATAEDLGQQGPDYTHGFGLVDAKAAVDRIRADGGAGTYIRTASLAQGASYTVDVQVNAGETLRAVLGWTDPEVLYAGATPVADKALVNDLNLSVFYTTDGTTFLPYVPNPAEPYAPASRGVNTRDNTEVVEIAGAAAGTYRIIVHAAAINNFSSQQFVLVTNTRFLSPLLLDATATSTTSVVLTWNQPIEGATYDIIRRTAGGAPFTVATGLTATSYNDTSVTQNAAYVYQVTANVPGSTPIGSNPDLALTFALGDYSGVITFAQIFELRTFLNAVRGIANLPQFSWSIGPVPGADIRASHVTELRQSVTATRAALSLPAVTFTPATLTPGSSIIRSSDFAQIRDALK